MEGQRRAQSLVVLTLLQLCRAAVKDTQPQWYSANIISAGFQPKLISEIFSTDATFSTANPIIVSTKDRDDDIRVLSTLSPPASLSSSSSATFETSSTAFPSSSHPNRLSSSLSPSLPEYVSSLTPLQQFIPSEQIQSFQQLKPSTVEIQQQTSPADFGPKQPTLKIISEVQPQRSVQIQEQSTPENTIPQDFPFELVSQGGLIGTEPESSTSRPAQPFPPRSNYFLIYQQAPQSIQGYPNQPSSPRSTTKQTFTSSAPPVTSFFSPTFSSPTFSTTTLPTTIRTSPFFFTTQPPPTPNLSPSTTPRVTVTSLSTIGSSRDISSGITNCNIPPSTSPLPQLSSGRPLPIDKLFPLKIRVIAPSGSITNVNFNPSFKPTKPTTTRKPTTRRSPKPRKNTYERCLQGCRKNGQALCAAPLSQFPVDPKTLRGFPSVCHMACHNSYRKDAFEKLIDGSCSKLRTRIRPVDMNSKLKRDELQKVQYFLDNSEKQPILEFTGIYS